MFPYSTHLRTKSQSAFRFLVSHRAACGYSHFDTWITAGCIINNLPNNSLPVTAMWGPIASSRVIAPLASWLLLDLTMTTTTTSKRYCVVRGAPGFYTNAEIADVFRLSPGRLDLSLISHDDMSRQGRAQKRTACIGVEQAFRQLTLLAYSMWNSFQQKAEVECWYLIIMYNKLVK